MKTPIATFFEAWEIQDADVRFNMLLGVVAENVTYDDPRTQNTLEGLSALSDYLGMFSANAPGWTAEVKKYDEISNVARVTVSFSGPGPNGSNQEQLGQYFIKQQNGLLSQLVGFAGTGELQ